MNHPKPCTFYKGEDFSQNIWPYEFCDVQVHTCYDYNTLVNVAPCALDDRCRLLNGHTCIPKNLEDDEFLCGPEVAEDEILTHLGSFLWVVFVVAAIIWFICVYTRTCWYQRYNVGDELDHADAF